MARTWNPRTWVTGDALNATNMNTIRDSLKAVGDPWDAFTPTWTSTGTAPSLGNGTLSGASALMGKLMHFRVTLTMGSTTTYGTGTWLFALPTVPNLPTNAGMTSGGVAFDSSATVRKAVQIVMNAALSQVYLLDTAGTGNVFATAPFTWASGDMLTFAGTYESS